MCIRWHRFIQSNIKQRHYSCTNTGSYLYPKEDINSNPVMHHCIFFVWWESSPDYGACCAQDMWIIGHKMSPMCGAPTFRSDKYAVHCT